MLIQTTESKIRVSRKRAMFRQIRYVAVWLFLTLIVVGGLTACRSPQKTELRKLVPNGAIIYLEIDNVARTLELLTAGQAFRQFAESAPDYTIFENVQIAVAVNGFETIEEDAALNFKPRFVAVAETHAWSWQTVSFAENQLAGLVVKNFGDDAKLEKTERENGTFSPGRQVTNGAFTPLFAAV